jgi:hypothetical protein
MKTLDSVAGASRDAADVVEVPLRWQGVVFRLGALAGQVPQLRASQAVTAEWVAYSTNLLAEAAELLMYYGANEDCVAPTPDDTREGERVSTRKPTEPKEPA